MRPVSRIKPLRAPFLLVAFMFSASAAVNADSYFDAGVSNYQKKDFKKALLYFQQAMRNNPSDANAIYYQALCLQSLGNQKEAIKLYATLVCSFAGTQASQLAAGNLGRLDPQYLQQLTRAKTPSAGAAPAATGGQTEAGSALPEYMQVRNDIDSLPAEARIPFQREGNLIMIDALLNNRPQRMVFDTGAEMVAVGKNHLRGLQITAPEGKPVGKAQGVGSGGGVNIWAMKADVKVGTILRRNFTVYVQEEMPTPPLLGQTFFKDFQYTIDSNSTDRSTGTIHFVKKGAAVASSVGDRYSVPFTRAGNNMVVSVQVNGKTTPMYFDTGASGNTFSVEQLKQLRIEIPSDATPETSTGIGGSTTGYGFTVSSMKLGPIEKHDCYISAVDSANMRYPLLGQNFFGDWQYTIDNAAGMIRFVRR